MTTILLVRHGETDEVGKILTGWLPGRNLNRTGWAQVEALAKHLAHQPLQAVYTSPLERTYETAATIAQTHGLLPISLDALGEVRLGEWEGRSFADLEPDPMWKAFNAKRSMIRPPGGELMLEVQTRMIKTIIDLRQQHENDTIAVVSHGDPIRSVIAYCLGIPLDLLSRFVIDPASVSALRFYEDQLQMLYVNCARDFLA